MFTGIAETLGKVQGISLRKTNITFDIASPISNQLKIDQSIAHNGVCLTVEEVYDTYHSVTAIWETLQKTNLGELRLGQYVNLERCLPLNGRLDGHIVQGHVDQTATCTSIQEEGGSWRFRFEYKTSMSSFLIEKGSICINGVSLTLVDVSSSSFSVAIIPYTFEHTTFKNLQVGNTVNVEFDVIGKYIKSLLHQKGILV